MRTEKLLFRWIGSNIDKMAGRKRANLTQAQREKYLKYLDEALNPLKGLFAKNPEEEYLGKVVSKKTKEKLWQFKSSLPCLCFTELDLGDSSDHISRFGRMGFGFTKQFIIQQGGGPVQYCLGTQDCDRVKDLATVQRFLKSIKNRNALDLSTSQAFLRLTHFYKRTREVIKYRKTAKGKSAPEAGGKKQKNNKPKPSQEDVLAAKARYVFQRDMPHLEEYEWRLVFSDNHERWHRHRGEDLPKSARFHIEAGNDLQMLIVPDNRCFQIVHELPIFADRLFTIPEKPVQVVSLEILNRAY